MEMVHRVAPSCGVGVLVVNLQGKVQTKAGKVLQRFCRACGEQGSCEVRTGEAGSTLDPTVPTSPPTRPHPLAGVDHVGNCLRLLP